MNTDKILTYRGSGSDLATDIIAMLPPEEIQRLLFVLPDLAPTPEPVEAPPESLPENTIQPFATVEDLRQAVTDGVVTEAYAESIYEAVEAQEANQKEKDRIASLTPKEKADENIKILQGKIKEFREARIAAQVTATMYEGHEITATKLLKRIKEMRRQMK